MRTLFSLAGLFILSIVAMPRDAAASEWGCEVLLCASSSNPSWHGVAECHPPMERLIEAMSHPGFSWPACPEGGAGKPGYERYADCPEGWTPASNPNADHGGRELSYCVRRNACGDDRWFTQFRNRDICGDTEYMPRPVRSDPYYFEIRDSRSGTIVRHWFDLRR